jgi:hypothetical protein
LLIGGTWDGDRAIVEVVVDQPIVELIPDLIADAESEVRRYGDVSLVEQAVDIAPHEDTVVYFMRLVLVKWSDVRGVECR